MDFEKVLFEFMAFVGSGIHGVIEVFIFGIEVAFCLGLSVHVIVDGSVRIVAVVVPVVVSSRSHE